jgi:hypothetical protein
VHAAGRKMSAEGSVLREHAGQAAEVGLGRLEAARVRGEPVARFRQRLRVAIWPGVDGRTKVWKQTTQPTDRVAESRSENVVKAAL